MTLSRSPTYPTPRLSATSARMVVVVGLHALLLAGLSQGLRHAPAKPTEPTVVRLDSEPRPPREPAPIPLAPPTFSPLQPVLITPPSPPADASPHLSPPERSLGEQIARDEQAIRPSTGTGPVAPPAASSGPRTAAQLCATMPLPTLPAVAWSGTAHFQVTATLSQGRVVDVDIRALTAGLDGRSRRALASALEHTLKDGYRCQGDGRFTQEFVLTVE